MQSTEIVAVIAGPEEDGPSKGLGGHWALSLAEGRGPVWPWASKVIFYSLDSPRGGTYAPPPSSVDIVTGWDIIPYLAASSLVHVSRPHTRAGEIAVLAGRLLGKRLVVSDLATETSSLGRSFGLVELADCVICSPSDSGIDPDQGSVKVMKLGHGGWMRSLDEVYGSLLRTGEVQR